jgi:hypothetical protein
VIRFRDGLRWIDSFIGEVLVVCPRCGGCARVAAADSATMYLFAPRTLACAACGLSRSWEGDSLTRHAGRSAVDDHFELPLWIQAPCCGETLWAYNWRHLDLIESFVRAVHRERRPNAYGWSNRSVVSRFPRWMKSAHNRVALLACIARLRQNHGR